LLHVSQYFETFNQIPDGYHKQKFFWRKDPGYLIPEFIGDINGDGYGDFAVNRWAADERTDPGDALYKSAVITNINQPDSSQVFYGTVFKGIKDYNGDGYDDVLDIWNMVVYFGSEGGLTYDTLKLDYPFSHSDRTILYYTGDISGDGKSELIINALYTIFCRCERR
jgi:hypothetical protein